jgi:hypothetical protein
MKNKITIFTILTVFMIASSFTTKKTTNVKTCYYNMYTTTGTFLGTWSINVPDNVSCGSKEAKALAVADFKVWG